MHDSHIVGLPHPATKQVLLNSILGRSRMMFALLVYRNAAGRRWLLNTILNEGDSGGLDSNDTAFEQDLVKVEFVSKRELGEDDRDAFAAAGFTLGKQHGRIWPQFRSLVPGGYPWYLNQSEAEMLLFALPRVRAVARLMRDDPQIWDRHLDGEIACVPENFNPATDFLRRDQIDWQPMLPPPEVSPETVSFDAATLARFRKLTQPKGFHLELDVAYAPLPLADTDRPRFPKLALAVDRASGFLGGFHIGNFKDADGAASLGTVLTNALHQLGQRPKTFRVQRPRVAAMLSNIAKELRVRIKLDRSLETLNSVRAAIEQQLSRPR
jgi:hypothetical protein